MKTDKYEQLLTKVFLQCHFLASTEKIRTIHLITNQNTGITFTSTGSTSRQIVVIISSSLMAEKHVRNDNKNDLFALGAT